MNEEKDLNFFINEAYRTGMSPAHVQNMMQTFGASQEDTDLAFKRLAEISPVFRTPAPQIERIPGQENAVAVFSEDDSWWEKMVKSFAQGTDMGKQAETMSSIVNQGFFGFDVDEEEAKQFMDAMNKVQSADMSPEFKKFMEIYEQKRADDGEEDPGWFSDLMAGTEALIETYHNEDGLSAGLIGQIFSQSMGAFASPEKLSILLGGTTIGAVGGGGTGAAAGGWGAIPGAIAGGYAGFRLSSSIVGGMVEAQSAVAELVSEELKNAGLEYNLQNLQKILNDGEAMRRVTYAAGARGLTIGSVEFITQGLGGRAVSSTVKLAKGGRKAQVLAGGVGLGIEAAGGGLGEYLGSAAAGQDASGADVLMEAIGGTATAPVTVLKGLIMAPGYNVNGERVSSTKAYQLVSEATPDQLDSMRIEIKNDPELKAMHDKKVKPLRTRREVIKANHSTLSKLSDEDANELIEVLYEIESLKDDKSSKTRVEELNKKAEEIRARAKDNPVSPETTAKDADGNDAPANSSFVLDTEQMENDSTPKAEPNSEGERLSEFDETQEDADGNVSNSSDKSAKIRARAERVQSRLAEVNKKLSEIATKYQETQAEDGTMGGESVMSDEDRAEYQSLRRERNSLEKEATGLRSAEKRAKKSNRPLFTLDQEETGEPISADTQSFTFDSLTEAGVPVPFARLMDNVINKAFASFKDKLPAAKIKLHTGMGSFNKAVRAVNEGRALQIGEVTFGWYDDKTQEIHMIDITNPEVQEALRKQGADPDMYLDNPVDLVTEEIAFHFGMQSLLSNKSVRERFVKHLLKLATTNVRLGNVLADRLYTYFPNGGQFLVSLLESQKKFGIIERLKQGTLAPSEISTLIEIAKKLDPKKAETLEEELIAGYVRDYIKSPNSYRNVWQRIADFINNFLPGKNKIDSEIKLRKFARTLARAIDGQSVTFDPTQVSSSGPKRSFRSKKDFTYLQDTTLYYDFDRQYGVEYMHWATKPPAVPQKITVKDYFHYRNWYNKMTANQEYPGIISNVYFIKDGKKHMVKPPRPLTDKQGNKVKMERIMTNSEIRRAKAQRERDIESEVRAQIAELNDETAQIWRDSGIDRYTYLPNFIPPSEYDQDGLIMGPSKSLEEQLEDAVIKKANVKALAESNMLPEILDSLKGFDGYISPFEHPEIYSMSGMKRVNEDGEPGEMVGPNVKFSTTSTGRDKIPSISEDGTFNGVRVAKPSTLPKTTMSVKYDVGGVADVVLKYGDNQQVEFKTSGGVEEILLLMDKGLSISHSTERHRETTLGRLKYLDIIYTSSEEELRALLQGRIDKEAESIRGALSERRLAGKTRREKEARYKELTSGRILEREMEIIMATKADLMADNGEVTVYLHQNLLKSLPARPSIFKGLVDVMFLGVETENNPEFTKAFLEDIKQAAFGGREVTDNEGNVSETKGTLDGVREGRQNLIEEYGKPIDFDSVESVKAFIEWVSTNSGAFHEKDDFVRALLMFKSRQPKGTRPTIFNKYPFISPSEGSDLLQAVDGYYREVTGEELTNRDSRSGSALAAVVISLDDLFSGEGRTAVRENVEGTDFGYYIGGLKEVVYLDEKVSLEFSDPKATDKTGLSQVIMDTPDLNQELDKQIREQLEKIEAQIKKSPNNKPNSQTLKKLIRLQNKIREAGYAIEAEVAEELSRYVQSGAVKYSKAATRKSITLTEKAGKKGVSVNQVLQVMGKASKAEQAVLEDLLSKYPGVEFISEEEFDQHLEDKMLQPLEEERAHADYGLDRLYGRKYRRLVATTVPFVGDDNIYGTAGIFDEHFDYPVHAHVRMFTDPDQPGVLYVSELQSDTYQKGLDAAYDGGFMTEEVVIEDYASDELDISVQNLPFLKHILENYDEYRTLIIVTAGGRENAMQSDWWDDVLRQVEIVPENRLDDPPNMGSLLSNALANDPNFNVRAFRLLLRQFALSNLKAPVNSTSKEIDEIMNDHFNKYPYVQEGEKNNLGNFSKDLVISIDYMADVLSDIAIGGEVTDMTPEERMKGYEGAVEALEKHRNREKEERKEGISSAKNSWEKQIIRYTIKRAQENGDKVVRFPTVKTAADIQWWDANSAELDEFMNEEFGVDRMWGGEMGEEMLSEEVAKQAPLRKRYRNLPKTLRSIGLESRLVRDEMGNTWHEVDTPPADVRMAMFSKANSRNNMGDVGGATWQMREKSSTEEFTDLWLTRLQDKYRRVFKLQEDVAKGKGGQVLKGQDFRMAEELMYGKAANDLERLESQTDKITQSLKENGITVEDLDEYLYNTHAKERNAVIRERTEGKNDAGSGKTDEQVDRYFAGLSSDKRAKLEATAGTVREILQDTRNAMIELGLETKETIDAFEQMFENYVPLQGKSQDEADLAYSPYPNGGTGFSVSGATTKKAKGRFTETENIVAQVIAQNAAVRIKGRTNEAMNALYELALNNPNESVWKVLDKEKDGYKSDDPNIVSVRVNGVQKAIRFKDASYAQSLRSMNMPQKNHFVKLMGSINSWLRAAFTSRNPEFILSNFSRDIQSAVFNASAEAEIEGGFLNGTGAMRRIFNLVGPTLKALIKEEVGADVDPSVKKYYAEFKEDGGKTGWAYQKSLEDIASELKVDDSGKTNAQKLIGGVKGALEFVEGMNDAFENSIRLSAYIAAREGGVSREKAAQFAKNITVNFNKQGEWGPAVNATYLFFNASVQGSARILRSLGSLKPPMRPDGSKREWYERATTAQKAAGGMVIMSGLLTLLNRASSDEDEDGELFYNKIPDYVKERNLIIMRPDGKNYWKIPMPYGYNIFANLGTTAVEVASGDRQPLEGLSFFAMSMMNAFSPISFGQAESLGRQVTKTSIPTAFKPFFEAYAFNETYFGGPVKAEQYPFGTPKPNSSMSFRSPEELKQFFSWVNEATGGSEDVPGVIDINPDGAWYIFEYFLGGTGRFVTRSIETGRKISADRTENPIDLDFNDIPFARIVYGEPSKYYDMQLFKDNEVEVKQLFSEFRENRIPNAGDRYKGIVQLNGELKMINKRLKVIRAEKRAAKKISNYSERVSKVQQLMEKERKLVMEFNRRYEKLRGKD